MSKMKKITLEQRVVYLEGKRRTKGFQLFVYEKDSLDYCFGRLSSKHMARNKISKQMHRRMYALNLMDNLHLPDYFYLPFLT